MGWHRTVRHIGSVVHSAVTVGVPVDLIHYFVAGGVCAGIGAAVIYVNGTIIGQGHAVCYREGLAAFNGERFVRRNGQVFIHRIACAVNLTVVSFKDKTAPGISILAALVRNRTGKYHGIALGGGREASLLVVSPCANSVGCNDAAANYNGSAGASVFRTAAADTSGFNKTAGNGDASAGGIVASADACAGAAAVRFNVTAVYRDCLGTVGAADTNIVFAALGSNGSTVYNNFAVCYGIRAAAGGSNGATVNMDGSVYQLFIIHLTAAADTGRAYITCCGDLSFGSQNDRAEIYIIRSSSDARRAVCAVRG